MVTGFHEESPQFEKELSKPGFDIINDLVFN